MYPQPSDFNKFFIDVDACTNYYWRLSLTLSCVSAFPLEAPTSSAKPKRSVTFNLNPTIILPCDPTKYKYTVYIFQCENSTCEESVKRVRYLLRNRSVNTVLSRRIESLESSLGEEEMAMRRLCQANAEASSALINVGKRAHRGCYLQLMDPFVEQWHMSMIEKRAEPRRRSCLWDEVVKVKEIESNKDRDGHEAHRKDLREYEEPLKRSSDHKVLYR